MFSCLSSIILSPPSGNVNMSPHETGDIHVESEGTATSDRHFAMRARESDVCQSRGAARPNRLGMSNGSKRATGKAAQTVLAHVSRGRPSHRRLPQRTRDRILTLARSRYTSFNDHHLHEKLVEQEGFSLSRETLRRLLRANGIGSPRKRRPPAHRQRRLRSAREGKLVQLDGSPHDWLQGRGPLLTALGMQDDASGKILAAQFFSSETSESYFRLLQSLLRRYGVPIAFYGDRSGVFTRNVDHWSIDEQFAGQRQPAQFGRALA
jgi:transposase